MKDNQITLEQQLENAIYLAADAHFGQEDKVGLPYILHPIAVMEKCDSIEEKIVAILHDVLEDTDKTEEDLQRFGIDPHLVDAVVAITKVEEETYREYLTRVAANPLALEVKYKDIEHNTSPKRMNGLDKDTREYLKKKYKKGLKILDDLVEKNFIGS